jgi:hypothetical protein
MAKNSIGIMRNAITYLCYALRRITTHPQLGEIGYGKVRNMSF